MRIARRMLITCLLPLAARAGISADYSIATAFPEEGGGEVASVDYRINTAAGPGEALASADFSIRGGYAGQLADVISIRIDGPPPPVTLPEAQATRLGVTATLDDATRSPLAADAVAWSMQSGPATVGPSGVVTAAHVYQDSPAVVAAAHAGLSASLGFTILNISDDDYGSYASDGLPDFWQVRNFGENGSQASPAADADGDGQVNLLEFAFGTDPAASSGGVIGFDATAVTTPGSPKLMVEGGNYYAVFGRRADYLAEGIRYTVRFSADLGSGGWTSSTAEPEPLTATGEIRAVRVAYPPELVPAAGAPQAAGFFQVRVEQTPP
jgi:hypothetical protein